MAVPEPKAEAGVESAIPGFLLEALPRAADSCWLRGCCAASGMRVLVRRIDGVPFAAAIRCLASMANLGDPSSARGAGIAPLLACAATCRGELVAGESTPASGVVFEPNSALAAGLPAEAPVDVWAVYDDVGDECLGSATTDPVTAADSLVHVARVLDGLAGGHGAVDSPALRIASGEPLVLALGLAPLEAERRSQYDAVSPWLTVAPERCLPPGMPSRAGDQYALAVLWTLFRTGRTPHEAPTADALVKSKFADPPEIDLLGGSERDVIARALSQDADERYASCSDFAAALRAALPDQVRNQAAENLMPNEPISAAPVIPEPVIPEAADDRDGATESPPPTSISGAADASAGAVAALPPEAAALEARMRTKPWQETTTYEPGRKSDAASPPTSADPRSQPEQPPPPPPPPQPPPPPPQQPEQPVTPSTPPASDPPTHASLAVAPYKPGDQILPGYRLVGLLGRGGFGEVWKATGPGGMSVAIKVIPNAVTKQGSRELKALKAVKDLQHGNVVPIFGFWFKNSRGHVLDENEASTKLPDILDSALRNTIDKIELIVAMGLGAGTLHDSLRKRQADGFDGIERQQLLEWLRQAAVAIDYCNRGGEPGGRHMSPILHCDIKPHNLLLVGNVVQVCDFGLAQVLNDVRATVNNLLTVAYAPPEMMIPPRIPSATTDQYALAVSFYELLTGRLPYPKQPSSDSEDISLVELMQAKIDGTLDVSLVGDEDQQILRRALSFDAAGRFGSCEEFIDALELVGGERPPPPPFPWFKALAVALGGVIAAGSVAYLVKTRPIERPEVRLPAPDYCGEAEDEIRAAVRATPAEGIPLIDLEKLERATELATKAKEIPAQADRADGVARAAVAIRQCWSELGDLSGDGTGLVAAAASIDGRLATLHDVTAAREAITVIRGEVARRADAAVDEALAKAVGEDCDVAEDRIRLAEANAGLLGRYDKQDGERLSRAALGVREIGKVVGQAAVGATVLDNAINRLAGIRMDLPPATGEMLGRCLSRQLIERAKGRLRPLGIPSQIPNVLPGGVVRGTIVDSLKDLELAVELDPKSVAGHNERGFCEMLLGKYEDAILSLTRALELLDERGEADAALRKDICWRRVYAFVKAKRFLEAAQEYAELMTGDPRVGAKLAQLQEEATNNGLHQDELAIIQLMLKHLDRDPDAFAGDPSRLDLLAQQAWLLACGVGEGAAERCVATAEAYLSAVDEAIRVAANSDAKGLLAKQRLSAVDTLAAARARAGDFTEAVKLATEAITAARAAGWDDEAAAFEKRRAAFENGRSWDNPAE